MPDAPPWFTKPWVRPIGERRAVVAAACYTIAGLCMVLLAIAGGSTPVLRVLALVAGAIFIGLGATLAATLRWRRMHGAATP